MTGYYDIHSHIIPGVDDGPHTIEESVKILQKEYDDGIRTIICSSHWRRGMFEPSLERLQAKFELVRQAAAEIAPDLTVLLGCEFHVNMEMVETLKKGLRPTMAGTRNVLAEFKNNVEKGYMRERCYALLTHGYQPILAHPERYEVIRKDTDFLRDLIKMGCQVQINSQSVIGDDGFFMKLFCKKLIRENLVHFIGSDAHDMGKRGPTMGRCIQYLDRLMGPEYTRRILIDNPKKMLSDN